MKSKVFACAMLCLSGIMLTGCMAMKTDDGDDAKAEKSTTEKVTNVVVKGAVKAAVRNSPIGIISKAVK